MLPLVSIITPCYNAAPFISQAIESVLAQSFGDWEMIIVDDCSSDDSLSIIQKYARIDFRIRYLRTNKPPGRHPAGNSTRGPATPKSILSSYGSTARESQGSKLPLRSLYKDV